MANHRVHLKKNDYFMSLAILASKRSKDPDTQVGACIVSDKNAIISLGHNGLPNGCKNKDFPWKNSKNQLEDKHTYVSYAVLTAIANANGANLNGSTIYVTLFPSNECAKQIIQFGIKRVVYYSDEKNVLLTVQAARVMLNAAGVEISQFKLKNPYFRMDLYYLPTDYTNLPENSQGGN